MADNNKLELVVEVDVNRANASIKSINTGLSSMEQAAGKAARGASAGIDGLTVSMVKGSAAGNLLADSIKKALDWAKEWTIGAAEHAAHTDKMSLSMAALAKAHGVNAEASNRAVEAVKKVGFGTQDAIHAVDRLMVADMNLSKAEGLAKVAKDAAAIENITPGEALEKLLMAIESGASRGLRTMGIFVDLNKEVDRQEKLTGRTLDENEVRQLRYNAVMREAAKIQGAAAAATGSAEAQSAALAREVNELKEAVGEQFQGYLRSWVGHLRDLVGFLKDNSDWLVKFGEAAIFVAGAIVTYGIITKIAGIASAVQGLALALTANPIGLLLTGVVAAGAIIYYEYNKMHEGMDRTFDDMRRKGIQKDLFSGKLKPDDVKKMGYTDDQVKEIIGGRRMLPGDTWDDFSGVGFPKLKILGKGELSDDEVNRIATERKKRGEAERSAQELYMRAVEERKSAEHDQARARIEDSMKIIESTHSETQAAKESLNVVLLSMQERQAGIEKIKEEEKREIEQRSTYTDEKSGAVRHFKLNASTLETIHKATAERLAAFDMKFNEEESRRLEQMWKAAAARSQKMFELLYLEPMKQNLYVWEQASQWQDKIDDQGRSAAIAAVDQRKNLQLAQLESVDARTLQDKVALENAKTAIEVQAMKDRTKIELEEIDARTERQVDEARKAAMAQGIFYEPYLDQIGNKIRELGQHEKDVLQKATTTEIDVAQIKGATSTRKLVTDQYQSIFQSLKQQAGGVFDALVTKSQSVWSAIGNSLKTALLTAIKDVVTSRVAAMLMNMFVPGANVQMQQGGVGKGGGSGLLGGLGGILGIGAVPVFAGGAPGGTPPFLPSGGAGAGAGSGAGLGSILPPIFGTGSSIRFPGSAVGGTPPFVPSSSGGGAGIGAAPAAGGIFSKAGLAGMLPGLKSFFGFGDNKWVDMGGGRMATGGWISQYGSFGDKLQALGKSDAALMGGALLAMDGLRRGGKIGVAETTAGGALIGYKFGGPLGAAIGGVAGAVAGIVRLFVKGAADKAKEKIKALYGVDIADKGVLQQIVDMAKSGFGGNLDMAIRSPQIRDLIQLYAMTTGQKATGMPGTVTPLSLVETGGSLFQSPQYNNGTPLPALGGLPGLDQIGAGTPSGGGLVIQLDGPATTALLQGQAVQAITNNPRLVQSASMAATKSNANRRELTSLQLSPGTIVS
ncbi:MAG: hypothetical protein LAQ69_45655 [Acidobacteriia bacterium]|nr:hypothetical protein [Terriglobia bacterium]